MKAGEERVRVQKIFNTNTMHTGNIDQSFDRGVKNKIRKSFIDSVLSVNVAEKCLWTLFFSSLRQFVWCVNIFKTSLALWLTKFCVWNPFGIKIPKTFLLFRFFCLFRAAESIISFCWIEWYNTTKTENRFYVHSIENKRWLSVS